MTTVTIKFLEELIKPKLSDDEYRQVLKMYETQYAFEKSFIIVNNWRNEHLKICPILKKKIIKDVTKRNHIDSRTGIWMTTCGKHCWHNEKGSF